MAEQLGEAVLILRTDDTRFDRGVTDAKGKSQDLGRTLDATSGSAGNLTQKLDGAGAAANRFSAAGREVVAVSGAQRAGTQQLVMNLSDATTMYQLGAKTSQIFASQIGQVVQSIQLMSNGTSKFASFMGSGWGLALTGAAMVLLPLISNLIGSGDAADDAGKSHQTLADQLDRTKNSYDDVKKALIAYNAEQKKGNETTLEAAQAAAASAQTLLGEAIAIRQKNKALLDSASAQMDNPRNAQEASGAAISAVLLQGRVASNDAEIARLKQDQRDANAGLAGARANIASDPVASVKERFDRLRDAARGSISDVDKLTVRLTELNKQEEGAVKKARDDKSGKTDRDAEAAAKRAQREAEKEARQQESYNRDLAGLAKDLIDVRKQMAGTIEERYKIEQQALDTAIGEQRRRIQDNRDYSAAEKAKLLAQLDIKAALERELLERRRREEVARQDLEVAQALRANEQDLLARQLRLAETREERRAIELRILDLTYEQERAQLEALIASRDATEAQKQIAEARLAVLGQLKSGDQKAIEREYESPIQRYLRELNGVGKNINDEMEKVAVNGLQSLEDRLTAVIMQTKSLGAAFKEIANQIIADLIRIAIQRTAIAPIANALFGSGGIGSTAGAVDEMSGGGGYPTFGGGSQGNKPGVLSVLGSVGKSLFGSFFGGHADGGLIPSGGWGIVGERGPEPVFATSAGVHVKPNSSMAAGGRPGAVHVTVSGARGNAEIEAMVRSGVQQGIASYDNVVGDRVKDHLSRRG